MNKNHGSLKVSIVLIIILLAGLVFFISNIKKENPVEVVTQNQINITDFTDIKNGTYVIEGDKVQFTNGIAELPVAPGSASKNTFTIYGDPVVGDVNGDGKSDQIFFIINQTPGTATFVYVAAAINRDGKYFGTNAVSLGDRVSPQSIEIKNGVASVSYLSRKDDEPMAAEPTVKTTKNVIVKAWELVEVK